MTTYEHAVHHSCHYFLLHCCRKAAATTAAIAPPLTMPLPLLPLCYRCHH